MRKWIVGAFVALLSLAFVPSVSHAQFEKGNFTLELSGQGANDKDFDSGSAALNLDLGYFLTNEVSVGLRQGLIWGDGGSEWGGGTAAYADYTFDLQKWQPYVGLNVGYAYGSGVDDSWSAGPEAGVKYFVNSTTFIDFRAAYEFNLEEGIDEGAFQYGIGIGFRW
jgi:hypothetical protein